MFAYVGNDKCGVFVKKVQTGWMTFLRIWHLVCSCQCGRAKKGDIHLVVFKDRVGVTSHLTPLSCKPLDRCM